MSKNLPLSIDPDDEFTVPGEVIEIPCKPSKTVLEVDKDDEFTVPGIAIEIPVKPTSRNTSAKDAKPIPKLPEGWDKVSTDSEYEAVTDNPTIPLTVQFASSGRNKEYLHPKHRLSKYQLLDIRNQLKKLGEQDTLKIYETPLALLDYFKDEFDIEWRHAKDPNKRRYVKTIKVFMFWSFKDIEFLFANKEDYVFYVLPKLERIRRITTAFNRPIPLPYEIKLPGQKGYQWYSLSIEIIDISAMQGSKSLETYLSNVGICTNDKGIYSKADKAKITEKLVDCVKKFLRYIRSDTQLEEVFTRTMNFYNQVATLIDVESRENWGLSTGKIVANMVSEWIAKQADIPLEDITEEETGKVTPGLYQYTRLSSPEAIKQLSHITGNKNLLYLGMTDGGRCVKERTLINVLRGVLADLDILSCYANGLLNQIFPVGNPKIIFSSMKFKDWEKRYSKKLVPGIWYGRISWKNAPFKQDILISKEEKQFTAWDYYQRQYVDSSASDSHRQYDASMYLMTETVHQAALNHDLLQLLKTCSSDKEYGWIRENAVIESFAFYSKDEEIDTLNESMLLIEAFDKYKKGGIKWNSTWKRIELRNLLSTLIERRAMHKGILKLYHQRYGKNNKDATLEDIPEKEFLEYDSMNDVPVELKKYWKENNIEPITKGGKVIVELSANDFSYHSSIQEFIKLIGNTIYGCIASAFFSTNGTGISNFIVGNNITARARTLAWCMAKGLYSLMSITDGGVFNINEVCFYKKKSLTIFANIAHEIFTDKSRHQVVEIKPLYGFEIPENKEMFKVLKNKELPHVQLKAWEHLTSIFGQIDIFKYNQFSFEVKALYTSCELRNKSDYRLINEVNDKKVVKIRGLKQTDEDNTASNIFSDIVENKPGKHSQVSKHLIGLNEWRTRENLNKNLLPHDQISQTKDFYSLTPLGVRFINPEHRKDILRVYDQLRIREDEVGIAQLTALESLEDWEEYKAKKTRAAKNKEN